MLILRLSAAYFAFAVLTLVGCAHPNLNVQTQRGVEIAAGQVTREFEAAELVRDVRVPYRPSDFLPIAEAPDVAACPEEFDIECELERMFAGALPTG